MYVNNNNQTNLKGEGGCGGVGVGGAFTTHLFLLARLERTLVSINLKWGEKKEDMRTYETLACILF